MAVASSPQSNIISIKQKRTKDPGVRVHHGRVYDSANGKTCHQCRQKTMDFAANCKNQKINKPCSMKFCQKCLLNRYGEKAGEVDLLENWSCPRCRGLCNCSNCMKKRGHQPTGALVQTAKAVGFSSVSELLQAKGPENFVHKRPVKDIGTSAQKLTTLGKEIQTTLRRKRGKENLFDGKLHINTDAVATNAVEMPVKKPNKMKREDLKVTQIGDGGDTLLLKDDTPIKCQIPNNVDNKEEKDFEIIDSKEMDLDGSECRNYQQDGGRDKMITDSVMGYEADQLPEGTELAMVAGAELAPEDVGDGLQLLEFCATFGKILNLTKGQPEAALRELTSARSGRRGKYSTSVQFLTQLMSIILQSDSREISPTASSMSGLWLNDLKEVISRSQCKMDPVLLHKLNDGYETLEVSQKLKIFNFLCDEILGTEKIRNWIDVQNAKFVEEERGLKERLRAAKDQEKQMKQKMTAENNAALSSTEHGAIVSKTKSEAAQVHAQMLEIKDMISNKRQRSDAIRTDSVFVDNNGCAYWNLKCYSNGTDIIRQDIGSDYTVSSGERWRTYDKEQQKEIEKHISLRVRKIKRRRVKRELPIKCSESSASHGHIC